MSVNEQQKQITKLRSLLSKIEQLIIKLKLIRLEEAAKLQHTTRQNISYYIQIGQLKREILFGQKYVYKSDILKLKRSGPGPKPPAPLPRPTSIRLPYQPFQTLQNEDLRSFINRVKLTAVRETTTVEGTVTRAAKRLHYGHSLFYKLYRRLDSSRTLTTAKTKHAGGHSNEIHLPKSLFVIKSNEGLRSFIDRIQLAIITKAITNERSPQRAAHRLGYKYDSLLTLHRRLKARVNKH